jgi:hypothetical protein
MEDIINEIRSKDFKWNQLDESKKLYKHFDSLQNGDFTICFNDCKLDFWSQSFVTEKLSTLTKGNIYKILDKKIKDNVRSSGDMLIQIINDKNKKIWILTDRFAFSPELAQNSMRYDRLTWILNSDDDDPFK